MAYEGKTFIGGQLILEAETATATSPVTGEVLGTYHRGDVATAVRAVEAAYRASAHWASLGFATRNKHLNRVVEIMRDRAESIARLLTLEQGKPFQIAALPEVRGAITNLELAIGNAQHADGLMPPSEDPTKRIFAQRVPRGVVVAIQPWNYPVSIATAQIGPALAFGNAVVMLPAPSTSLVAWALAECFIDADLPPGVFNFVTGDGAIVGDALTSHERVAAIAFTGSTATGRAVARSSAGRATLLLELGGNGPTVLLDDADVELAAQEALASVSLNSGQACTAGELFLVHDAIYEPFTDRFAELVAKTVRLGDPFDPATTMGPLNDVGVAAKMSAHLDDALKGGASVLTGGALAEGFPTDLYWPVTLIGDVNASMQVFQEETFAPVAPIHRIHDDHNALRIMEETRYGLTAAVFSRDLARALRFAEKAPAGQVCINVNSTWADRHVAFGGRSGTASGIGRTSSLAGTLETYTEIKPIYVQM